METWLQSYIKDEKCQVELRKQGTLLLVHVYYFSNLNTITFEFTKLWQKVNI